MTNTPANDKLLGMRLIAMSDSYLQQKSDSIIKRNYFEDRVGMRIDIEHTGRKNNRIHRLIEDAKFEQSDASIIEVMYLSRLNGNKDQIQSLSTCDFVSECRNIFITGASGSGKTYLSNAFGIQACMNYYRTQYVSLPDLLFDLECARNSGTYKEAIQKYISPMLLIIDEWLQFKPTYTEANDIFEILFQRRNNSSTILCSQYQIERWHDQLGGYDSSLVKGILDQIVHDSYTIDIESVNFAKNLSASNKKTITSKRFAGERSSIM